MAPALTIGVPAEVAEEGVAAALEGLHVSAERSGADYEIIVAVNGPGGQVPALAGVAAFAHGGAAADEDPSDAAPAGGATRPVRVLRLPERSKVAAWNAIRRAARAPVIVFADADVRVAPEALALLVARLTREPEVALVGAREVPALGPGSGLVGRLAGLPYRAVLANVPGRLYAVRTAACPEQLPASVLAEDAYLTVRLGPARLGREPDALVHFRPPSTWREYLRDRVRNEVSKLQLAREFPDLLAAHPPQRYPWRALVRDLHPGEWVLLVPAMLVRLYAKMRARISVRRGVRPAWTLLPSTKRWH